MQSGHFCLSPTFPLVPQGPHLFFNSGIANGRQEVKGKVIRQQVQPIAASSSVRSHFYKIAPA